MVTALSDGSGEPVPHLWLPALSRWPGGECTPAAYVQNLGAVYDEQPSYERFTPVMDADLDPARLSHSGQGGGVGGDEAPGRP